MVPGWRDRRGPDCGQQASGRPGEGQGPEGQGIPSCPGLASQGPKNVKHFLVGVTAARHPVTGPVNGVAPGQPAASFRLSKGIAERFRRDSMLAGQLGFRSY